MGPLTFPMNKKRDQTMNMLLFTTDKEYIEEQQTGERRGKKQLVHVIYVISFFGILGKSENEMSVCG